MLALFYPLDDPYYSSTRHVQRTSNAHPLSLSLIVDPVILACYCIPTFFRIGSCAHGFLRFMCNRVLFSYACVRSCVR